MSERMKLEKEFGKSPPPPSEPPRIRKPLLTKKRDSVTGSSPNSVPDPMRRKSPRIREKNRNQNNTPTTTDDAVDDSSTPSAAVPIDLEATPIISTTPKAAPSTEVQAPKKSGSSSRTKAFLNPSPPSSVTRTPRSTLTRKDSREISKIIEFDHSAPQQIGRIHRRGIKKSVLTPPTSPSAPPSQQPAATVKKFSAPEVSAALPRGIKQSASTATVSPTVPPPQQPTTTVAKSKAPDIVPVFRSKPAPKTANLKKTVPKPTYQSGQSSKLEVVQPKTQVIPNRELPIRADITNGRESARGEKPPSLKTQKPIDIDTIELDSASNDASQTLIPERTNEYQSAFNPARFRKIVAKEQKKAEKKREVKVLMEEEVELDGQDGDQVMEEFDVARTDAGENEVEFVGTLTGADLSGNGKLSERNGRRRIRRNDEIPRPKANSTGKTSRCNDQQAMKEAADLVESSRKKTRQMEEEVEESNPYDEVIPNEEHIKKVFRHYMVGKMGIVMLPDNGIDASILRTIVAPELNNLLILQTVRLNRNKIKTIPAEMKQTFRRAKVLDFGSNGVEHLPRWTYSECGENVKHLLLPRNLLKVLPCDNIGLLTNLEVLDVSSNYLGELPAGLGSLKKLRVLNVSHNNLTSLPEDLGLENKNLICLDIRDNEDYGTGLPSALEGCAYKIQDFFFDGTRLHKALSKKDYHQVPARDLVLFLIQLDQEKVEELWVQKERARMRREQLKKERESR